MEIYQLRTFLVVVGERHITRAARHLRMSQPAVSEQIKALESHLGLKLLERDRHGVHPTRAAEELLPYIERVIEAAEDVGSRAGRLRNQRQGRLALGTILQPDAVRLSGLIRVLLSKDPLLDVTVRHCDSNSALTHLRSHQLDATFHLGRTVPHGTTGVDLRDVVYRVAAPAEWRERLAGADWPRLATLPWVVTGPGLASCRVTMEQFAMRGLSPAKTLRGEFESSYVSMIEAGLGVGFVREDLAREAATRGRLFILGRTRATLQLRMIFLAARVHDPLVDNLVAAVRTVWHGQSR